MHVVGDRAAERDEFGAGHDRREPALRHRHAQQPIERQAGFGPQDSARAVESQDAIQHVGDDQPSVLVHADIAVGSAHSEAEDAARPRPQRVLRLVEKGRPA